MIQPVSKTTYLTIEGSYDSEKKELSVGDEKIQHVTKGFWAWVGWLFGRNVNIKIYSDKKVLSLYVSKETAQEKAHATEKIGRVFAQTLYKKAIAKPKGFEIIQAPVKKQIPKIQEAKRNEIQKELKQNGIPLTCREFTPLAQPNHMREDQIKAYLESLPTEKHREIKGKLFNNIQKISYQELQTALFSCAEELNRILNDKEYAIGYAENKSQKWIAELALSYMKKTPKESFSTFTSMGLSGSSQQSPLTDKTDNYVVFDDAGYSGTQLCELLEDLVNEIAKHPDRPRKICLVVPFLSDRAKEKLKTSWYSLLPKRAPGTELHLITSPIKVTSFADKYPPDSKDRAELFACERELVEKHLEQFDPAHAKSYLGERQKDTKCLTYMEWKVPDDVSVPHNILLGGKLPYYHFFTEFSPPYKAKE